MKKPLAIDEAERERVRAALERYKSDHGGIGNPELQARMVAFLVCEDSDVPLSTLQRFMKGTHRTSDEMIRRYQNFLNEAAASPPYETMGEAIVSFYSNTLKANQYAQLKGIIPSRFARRYRVYAKGIRKYLDPEKPVPYKGVPVFDPPLAPAFHIPYSWLETTPLAGTPFLRVIERVVNETRNPLVTEIEENLGTVVQAVFEGVLGFASERQIFVATLRGAHPLRFFPRLYLLYNARSADPDKAVIDGAASLSAKIAPSAIRWKPSRSDSFLSSTATGTRHRPACDEARALRRENLRLWGMVDVFVKAGRAGGIPNGLGSCSRFGRLCTYTMCPHCLRA
ncbi:MAG: hypothetical protein AB7L90_25925 [Hyphomicrobiaceae bacterium]